MYLCLPIRRRDGRVAEGAGLLNRCSVLGRYRGFESLSLRKKKLFHAYARNSFFYSMQRKIILSQIRLIPSNSYSHPLISSFRFF